MAKEVKNRPERRVLIVDDDQDDLAAMGDSFRDLTENRWHIHTAAGVGEALAVLEAEKIDLAVLAVNSPVLDVSLVFGSLSQGRPPFKKTVLISKVAGDKIAAGLAGQADRILEKPVSPEGLKFVFVQLCELLDWAAPQGFQGVLRSVGLSDLVQMECLARNSSMLELYREHSLGRIYIENGQIIHATCGEISGEGAFQKLLTLAGGTFELHEFELPPERTINRTWEFLLARSAQQRESRALRGNSSGAFPADGESVSSEPARPALEMLIASGSGEMLYHWQCPVPAQRVLLLQNITLCAEQLIPDLQLGRLDRVEVQLPDGRAVLQPRTDRLIFVRVAANAVNHEG